MDIVIVEDDYLQAGWLESELKKEFPGAEIRQVKTELDFRKQLDALAANPPNIIIMDIMLRWTHPSPNMTPAPPAVREGGFYRAGIRCQHLLQEEEKTRHIPLVLYTILREEDLETELEDLPTHTVHLSKTGDAGAIIMAIQSLIRQ